MTFTVYAFFVLIVSLAIVSGNVLIVLVLLRTDALSLVNWYFFMSLTMSDLCIGVFVTPFSFWTSLFDRWIFGERFCHAEAYLATVFWTTSTCSLLCNSIDQYVAMRKQDRYSSIMTRTRSICWVMLLWLAALSFCIPPISKARYSTSAFVCLMDWRHQRAYFLTSGLLVLLPACVALACVNLYVFTSSFRRDRKGYDDVTGLRRLNLYVMNVVIGGVYVISWLPICAFQIYEAMRETSPFSSTSSFSSSSSAPSSSSFSSSFSSSSYSYASTLPPLHFCLVWLAMANSCWKFPIYLFCFDDFRIGLRTILWTRPSSISDNDVCCQC